MPKKSNNPATTQTAHTAEDSEPVLRKAENKKKNIFIATATSEIVSANNFSEGEGNVKTLQCVTDNEGNIYPIISGNAIKYNLRKVLEYLYPQDCNRYFDENSKQYTFHNEHFDPDKYLDDRVFGFCKMENKNSDNQTASRRANLLVSPFVAMTPYQNDRFFNTCFPGANPNSKKKEYNSIFETEVYFGRYQNRYALFNDGSLTADDNKKIIEAIMQNSIVGGNHSTIHCDYSPESYIVRLSYEYSDRLHNSFVLRNKNVSLSDIFVQKIINNTNGMFNKKRGDCIIIGGEIVYTIESSTLETLKNAGVIIVEGSIDDLTEVILQNI